MKNKVKNNMINYRWIMAALCAAVVFVAVGMCSSTRNLFLIPVTTALDLSRSAYAVTDSIRFISTAVISFFFGTLVNRFGAKKLLITGLVLLAFSCVGFSMAQTVWELYASSCLLGIGFSWTSTTMIGYIINSWFTQNKGTVLGAVLSLNGLAAAIVTPIITPVLNDQNNIYGYRTVYLYFALLLTVVVIATLFFFKQPTANDVQPSSNAKKQSGRRDWDGIDYSVAKTMPYFYGTLVCIFLTGFVLQGMAGISAAHMTDVGFTPEYVAKVISIRALVLMGSKFLAGFLYDRAGFRTAVTLCNCCAIIATFLLATLTNNPTGMIIAMIFGILDAISLPLETVMLPIYAADLFGQKSYNKIIGIFTSVNVAGYALGGPVINRFFDYYGSYKNILFILSAVMLIVMIALQFIITEANKHKRSV